VAAGWKLTFDAQRANLKGEAHGLPIVAGVSLDNGRFVTSARFTLPRPQLRNFLTFMEPVWNAYLLERARRLV
jgi:hypothetical protein